MTRAQRYNSIIVILILFENLFLWIFHKYYITSQTVNAFGYFATSVLIGITVLAKFINAGPLQVYDYPAAKRKTALLLLFAGCYLLLNELTIQLIKTWKYELSSDIIPAVQLMSKTLLAGGYPYGKDVLVPITIHRISNYLPMHWLPFTLAEYFHFDYRTVSFGIWTTAAFIVMYRSMRSRNLQMQLLIPVLFTAIYALITFQYPSVISVTIEIMVAGYYMLLLMSLNQKNYVLTGMAIAICLLSRYFVLLWLPLWAFVLFISGNKKALLKTSAVTVLAICFIYIIPFLSRDWSSLGHSLKDYETLPYNEWLHFSYDNHPMHLFDGTGFAFLFFEKYKNGLLVEGYLYYKIMFMFMLSLSLALMGGWYWLNRKRIHTNVFLMASLKIYLSVFLTFILVPYTYLMVTANFISIALLAEQARYKITD